MLFVAFYDRTARPRQQAAGGNAGHQEEIWENAILKEMDLQEDATAMDRNGRIGGHKA